MAGMQGLNDMLEPVLGPLFARTFVLRGGARMLRLQGRDVNVAPGFHLVVTTTLGAAGRLWTDIGLLAHLNVSQVHMQALRFAQLELGVCTQATQSSQRSSWDS